MCPHTDSCSFRYSTNKRALSLTRSTPHLRQVAVRFPRLFAQVHHIPAQCLRSNGNLSKMLVIVTEVYSQEHLEQQEREADNPVD